MTLTPVSASSTSTKLRARAIRCQRASARDPAEHRHGSAGRVDDDLGARGLRDIAHDPRVRGLLEHRHVGIEALHDVREIPAASAPPLRML